LIDPVGTLLVAASLSLLDVPFISQSEALCGGAAAAMVMRYWGAADVAAETFAPLVDRSAGGIRTGALVDAVRARGFEAIGAEGTADLVQGELARGRPGIALIQDRPGTFHYVVVVGWHERAVVLHDPARIPFVLSDPRDFDRKWAASGRWMMVAAPDRSATAIDRSATASAVATGSAAIDPACDALVADGVRSAGEKDLARAERVLADAAFRCPGAAPLRELAGVRLLQRRWRDVRELATQAVGIDHADVHAWRLLATARFVEGDRDGALDAWNRIGEPVLDLVSVSGLTRTSHRAVERTIGLESGDLLTRPRVNRAARRLDSLPAAFATRLEFVPRPAGRAEVRAHVVERPALPTGRLTWLAIGVRAAAARELQLPIASPAERGDRLDALWRFWPHRPAVGFSYRIPGALGLFAIDGTAERQPFTDATTPDADRVTATASWSDWATSWLRWEIRGGASRWDREGAFAQMGASGDVERGRARFGAALDVWAGESRFASAELSAAWRSSLVRRGFVLDGRAQLQAVGSAAPLDLWPAGDTGHARTTLLRAHPLLDDGRVSVERIGRSLASISVEAQHWWHVRGIVPAGGALFVDAARTSRRLRSDPIADVDVGAGVRLAVSGAGLVRVDVARGLRDGDVALSVSWTPR